MPLIENSIRLNQKHFCVKIAKKMREYKGGAVYLRVYFNKLLQGQGILMSYGEKPAQAQYIDLRGQEIWQR